jgi:1-phosphofructokinase family hexose kinase
VILSAGLTPAWQQILVFDRFRYGEVNRAAEAAWCSSGKVINAAIAAHGLGGPSLALATAGGPPLMQMDAELAGMGLPRRWVETAAATRVCTTILDRAAGIITELVENGRPITPEEQAAFVAAYAEEAARADVVVLTGSLPQGTPLSLYRELMERTPCPAVLDFRGQGLLAVLDHKPWVVKPNREELAQTVGHALQSDAELLAAMRDLNRRGATWVVVSQGAGPVCVSSTNRAFRVFPPPVDHVVNPIGSGDAMAAAIAWATRDGRDMVDAVRLGVAAASENLGQILPCRLDPRRVQELAATLYAEEVWQVGCS